MGKRKAVHEEQTIPPSKEAKVTTSQQTLATQTAIEFINEENKAEYKKLILDWLQSDFNRKEKSEHDFWHNRETIEEAFDNCNAMIALNNQNQAVGYMIWDIYDRSAEINIVEVREAYRRQGIFKNMQATFIDKFTDTFVLTGSVLPQSEKAFDNAGWESVIVVPFNRKKYYKIIRPGLPMLDVLPDGCVIAVCSENYHQVQKNPNKYNHLMRYFQIDLDEHQKLHTPIITDFHYEGYIGVYLNKELIVQGKARHIFNNETTLDTANLLIIDRIEPHQPELFNAKGFFNQPQQEAEPLSPFKQNISNYSPFLFNSSPRQISIEEKHEVIEDKCSKKADSRSIYTYGA